MRREDFHLKTQAGMPSCIKRESGGQRGNVVATCALRDFPCGLAVSLLPRR